MQEIQEIRDRECIELECLPCFGYQFRMILLNLANSPVRPFNPKLEPGFENTPYLNIIPE